MNSKKLAIAVMTTAMATTMVSAHLPSPNDVSLINGPLNGPRGNYAVKDGRVARASASDYSNKGPWSSSETYRGSYEIGYGDTVSYGEWNGKKLWWWAKFQADGTQIPGQFAPDGGTSPWILINSISAVETGAVSYQWKGWNGQLANTMGNTLAAELPTWKDGAEGAYSFTHDDIGAIPFDVGVQPAWDLAEQYPDIRQGWGIYVEKMDDAEWNLATEMVLDGYEMFNHSMTHAPSAQGWQWFYPGDDVPTHDPAVPVELRGLTVAGVWKVENNSRPSTSDKATDNTTWSMDFTTVSTQSSEIDPTAMRITGNAVEPRLLGDKGWTTDPNATATYSNEYVTITAKTYWDGIAPSSEAGAVQSITPKAGVDKVTIAATGQDFYVKYTNKDYTEGDDKYATVDNDGVLVATGIGWLELSPLIEKYPFWYNGYYFEKTWLATDETQATGPGGQLSALDLGRPGFIAKVQTSVGWTSSDYEVEIKDANDAINNNIYNRVTTSGEYFRKGKQSEYYGYPLDIYSEDTHKKLIEYKIPAARGGAKSGKPMPGDFFHPYRIDFDAFMICKTDWTADSKGAGYVFPDNPHVLLGLNEMADKIIESNGYMIREFHSVAPAAMDNSWHNGTDDYNSWDVNSSGAGLGGWWGGITQGQLKSHYDYLRGLIDGNRIVVLTPSEAVKYRITRNSVSAATITQAGSNYTLSIAQVEDPGAEYHDEISVLVSFGTAVTKMNVEYNTVDAEWGLNPRRAPRKMDTEGKVWSVSVNPFLGDATIIPGADFATTPSNIDEVAPKVAGIRPAYQGVQNGKIALQLPAGNFKAALFNAQGRMVSQADVMSHSGVVQTNLTTANLATGIYYLNVTANGAQVMPAAKVMIK